MINLKKEDCELVLQYFPQLNCELKQQRIWGTLLFSCQFDRNNELLEFKTGKTAITDSYEIEIDFKKLHLRLPKTYEHSGIIAAYAKEKNISLIDLHMFSDHSCCLGIYPEKDTISAFDFLTQLVIPYFFWHSYLRINGEEPWDAYPHGQDGFKQKNRELTKLIGQKTDNLTNDSFAAIGSLRNELCKCGSGKKYKRCCMDADNQLRSTITPLISANRIVDKWVRNDESKQAER